jgi:hypothetical protein
VLREGRKLGLYIIMATQDALVSTLGTTSGVRSQFQTCYYGGGDPYSAKALLGITPPNPPGKGVVWLRAQPVQEPALVRVPLVRNESITALLGPGATIVDVRPEAVEAVEVTARPAPAQAQEPPPLAASAPSGPFPGEVDPRIAQVRELLRQRKGNSEIIAEVWGVTGGRAFKSAAQELTEMIAQLVEGA